MRIRLRFLIPLLPCLFLSCQREQQLSRPPVAEAKPLMVLVGSDLSTFDPQIPFEVDSGYVHGNIFESLIEFDPSLRLSPGLAKRWTNPDDKTWRFYLNEEKRFSDGSRLTASDVRFSIERLKSLPNSDLLGFTQHIGSVRVQNEHTIDITTDAPLSILNDLVFIPILNEKYVRARDGNISTSPLGTGPYKLEKWERKKRILLSRNEYYSPRPDAEKVEFLISSEPTKVLEDVLKLKPDITLTLPYRRVEELRQKKPPELEIVSSNGLTVEYIVFNLNPVTTLFPEKNPLSDIRVRKAIAHAINREEMIRSIFYGYARPATQLIAPEIFGYDPSIQQPSMNLKEGKRLLAEAGYPQLELPLHTLEGGTYRFENLLVEQLGRVGIRGVIKTWKDADQMNSALQNGDFAMTITGYICTSGDAGELVSFCLHTRDASGIFGKGNYANYTSARVDEIGEQNLRVLRPKERLTMLQDAMRIVSGDLPYLPLMIYNDLYVVSNRVEWHPIISGELKVKYIKRK